MRSDAPEYHEPLKIETTETTNTKRKRRHSGAHAVRRRSGLLPVTSPARGDAFPRPSVVETSQSAFVFSGVAFLGFSAFSGPFCGRFWGRLRGGLVFCSIAHRTLKRRGGRFPRCLKQSRAPLPVDMGRRAQRRALEILVPRPHKTQMQNRETKQNTNTQKRQTHAKPRAPQRSLSPIVTHTQGINTQGTHTQGTNTQGTHTQGTHKTHAEDRHLRGRGGASWFTVVICAPPPLQRMPSSHALVSHMQSTNKRHTHNQNTDKTYTQETHTQYTNADKRKCLIVIESP